MAYGILNRWSAIRLSIVLCLVYSVCITSYSACSCSQDGNAASTCCSDKSGAFATSTGVYTRCCQEPANSKRQRQANSSQATGGCLWCPNRCGCTIPAKTDIAALQEDPTNNWRDLCAPDYFPVSNIAHLENQHQVNSEYLSTNPLLSTRGRHINVILCVFLC